MVASRIGVLGGTFDPIHLGHLDVALAAQRALSLAKVLFLPARVPPHKARPQQVSGYHRFAMAALATADYTNLRVSDVELCSSSSKPSYTSLTLQQLALVGYNATQLFFIMGSDAFAEIAQWYDYPELLDRSHFVVVSRSGLAAAELPQRLQKLASRMRTATTDGAQNPITNDATAIWLVDADIRNVSSSEIRERVAQGESIDDLLPPAVVSYISKHRLYANKSCG